ncbi:hypothetical protein NPIL_210871 [Nephila pilipes]|uniref:Uncharacterized protein n=1 Tax=Nephila pilipes TaxID=299642 RepID=A0A8X6MSD5_NEPPI|nr:hypothetical protein NPIL_210871 [Nephila pilipes]
MVFPFLSGGDETEHPEHVEIEKSRKEIADGVSRVRGILKRFQDSCEDIKKLVGDNIEYDALPKLFTLVDLSPPINSRTH